MFTNYLKTAWRSLLRNRTYTAINVFGLTVGLCACLLVATVVADDLSYDRQWSKGNDLYRIVMVNKMGDGLYDRMATSFQGLGNILKTDYPEVEAVAQLVTVKQRLKLDDKNPNGIEINALRADTAFWKMLDIQVLAGNPRRYVEGSSNIVITESFRKQFFPNENPVGKIVYDVPTYDQKSPYLITGVIKDLPSNTVFRSQMILLQKGRNEALNKEQFGTFSQQYVLLKPGTNAAALQAKLNKWYAGYVTVKNPYRFEFQPLKDIYLHSDFARYQDVKGDYTNIYIFSGVALLLLLIACVNFINLSTAKAIDRIRETGVRKVLGAGRKQIVFQFLTESLLFFIIAAALSTLIYRLALPPIETYLGHPLQQTFFSSLSLFASAYGGILLISLLTGFYPAWILSGFRPAATLKGKLFTGSSFARNAIRKALVVVQFSISIAVLISLIVVQQQVSFLKHADIGYQTNNLLSVEAISWDGKGGAFKNEMRRLPDVASASISDWAPTEGAGSMSKEIDDPSHPGNKINVWFINGDPDLTQTLGLHLQSGRLLSSSFPSDLLSQDSLMQMTAEQYKSVANLQSSLITAYTAKALQITTLNTILSNVNNTPVGIVNDFHNESLKDAMKPTIILAEQSPQYGGMLLRVKPGAEQTVLASLNKLWRQFYPDKLLNTRWVDDMVADQYKAEAKLQNLFVFFSGLSLLLAVLGIFGLIVQATHQRVKEIGIRKALGASVLSLVRLFSIDFIKLVLLAASVASPLTGWLMNQWLQDFAYRISMSWWMFAGASLFAVLIAFITIAVQSVKAAIANPADSLRTE